MTGKQTKWLIDEYTNIHAFACTRMRARVHTHTHSETLTQSRENFNSATLKIESFHLQCFIIKILSTLSQCFITRTHTHAHTHKLPIPPPFTNNLLVLLEWMSYLDNTLCAAIKYCLFSLADVNNSPMEKTSGAAASHYWLPWDSQIRSQSILIKPWYQSTIYVDSTQMMDFSYCLISWTMFKPNTWSPARPLMLHHDIFVKYQ